MAAGAFNKQYGDITEVTFRRTPRTLTVEGDFDKVTANWRKEVENVPEELKPINNAGTLLEEVNKTEDSEEDDAFFKKERRNFWYPTTKLIYKLTT